MAIKYAVYPGTVRSKTDGDIHHIDAEQIVFLYGVRRNECVIVRAEYHTRPEMREFVERAEKLISLRPRSDGNYNLPKGGA